MMNIKQILGKTRGQVLAMVDRYVKDSIAKLGNKHEPITESGAVLHAWSNLLHELSRNRKDIPCSPEKVAAILLRNGVSKEKVKATSANITIELPNGTYRIYREPSGYPTGAVTLKYPSWVRVHHGFSEQELADILLAFDELIPEIEEHGQPLRDEIAMRERERKATRLAEDIALRALESIFAEKLAPLGIDHRLSMSFNGEITLTLRQYREWSITAPINVIKEELEKTGDVESLLSPVESGYFWMR